MIYMSIGTLLLIVGNVFCIVGLLILWARTLRPPKEDPRLSRGLQLLQSKISVLEDLSDRTENQVRQLIQILDEKARGLQSKMLQAQDTIRQIENSMHKSLSVAEIFQDKIPHEEIIERNQQSKYVQAAKLANEGRSVEEILKEVDLPRSEVEFIAKVNREDLSFDPELLPEWAKAKAFKRQEFEANLMDQVFQAPKRDFTALNNIETEFKKSVSEARETERLEEQRKMQMAERQKQIEEKAQAIKDSATQITKNIVRKVQFPRIDGFSRSKL